MHPGKLPNGTEQLMVDSYGRPKGLRQVLEERGVRTMGMNKKEMVNRLSQFDEFRYELTAVASYLAKDMGFHCIYLPKVHISIKGIITHKRYYFAFLFTHKYHPELNPIEMCWAKAKKYAREHCDYSFEGLKAIIPTALSTVSVETIRKLFRKCHDYHQAYVEGKTGI